MLNLKNVKIAFFDLDGVLSIPRYRDIDGNLSCGMLSEDWFITCQSTEDVYRDCEVSTKVVNLLRRLKNNGTKLYVLTHETNSGAYFNKVNFILKNYSDFFSSYTDVLFVSKVEDKVKLMEVKAKVNNVSNSECLIVEDTFDTCLQANDANFQVMHISELLIM